MARIAIVFGVLMVLLGGGLYIASVTRGLNQDNVDPATANPMIRGLTALIPAAFGLVLIILGAIAKNRSERVRMHTMHAAALIGLIGVGVPAWRVLKAMGADSIDMLPVGGNIAMLILSSVFLAMCVKSFIDVRRARRLREAESQAGPAK